MQIERLVAKAKTFLLDLDGTVYIEGALIGDMKNTLTALRESGRRLVYLTNNSSKTKEDYIARLSALGIYEKNDAVYTSGDATIAFLKKRYAGKRVYLAGTGKVRRSFSAAGIALDEENPEVLVLTYDTEIDYEKISKTALFLKRGIPYVATHPDINCPAKEVDLPDIGSYIKLFETSTGRVPDVVVGKPHTYMGDGVKELTGQSGNELVMVGDRLYTDIAFGVNNGFSSLLVLSGETTAESYRQSAIKASAVLPSLNEIVRYL